MFFISFIRSIVSKHKFLLLGIIGMLFAMTKENPALATITGEAAAHEPAVSFSITVLFIGLFLLFAKSSSLIEKWGLPPVLGELSVGILLGNLGLIGIHAFDNVHSNEVLKFLSELGLVILLFQAGLESNTKRILSAGGKASMVAAVGAVLPFILGSFIAAPLLLPELSFHGRLFIGACMASTAVAIAATLFKEYGKMKSPEAQIVLSSAVLDDVFGMVMLPVMTALVTTGSVSTGSIILIVIKSLAFLITAVLLGQLSAPYLGKIFSRINTGIGMKFTLALSLALIMAYFASLVGMSPIIGAFAAGLFLDPIHFKTFDNPRIVHDIETVFEHQSFTTEQMKSIRSVVGTHAHRHIEELIEPLAHFTVPLFFVLVGMQVDLRIFMNLHALFVAFCILLIPIISRLVASLFAGPGVNRRVIGFALVPNDEVGLVFATLGHQLGVLTNEAFTIIVFTLIMTTLVGSVAMNYFLQQAENPADDIPSLNIPFIGVPRFSGRQ